MSFFSPVLEFNSNIVCSLILETVGPAIRTSMTISLELIDHHALYTCL